MLQPQPPDEDFLTSASAPPRSTVASCEVVSGLAASILAASGDAASAPAAVDLTPAKGKVLPLPDPDPCKLGSARVQQEKTATKKIG
jgi:hypothetical protein